MGKSKSGYLTLEIQHKEEAMVDLNSIPLKLAHSGNYNQSRRSLNQVKFIVIHYTSNIGDTAKNNVDYFSEAFTQSSAHYFVSDSDIWQSVPLYNAAYAVGLGKMKGPYTGTNPSHYKICTNLNSVSIELCGSKTSREASAKTKQTASNLAVTLLKYFNLKPSSVIRHHDVTGKNCPAWAVEDPAKWLEIQMEINNLYYGKEEDEMTDTPENYEMFKKFMNKYQEEKAAEDPAWCRYAMEWASKCGLIRDGKPSCNVTRAELATVLQRLESIK